MQDSEAVEVLPPRASGWVVTCDHASNEVPDWVSGGDLGVSAADMSRHIAYDVGAAGVSRALADNLGGTGILSRFSRLVIDPNRGEDDPTLIMQIYDGSVIPANSGIDDQARGDRLARLYRPYHDRIATACEAVEDPILVSIHSFTPQLKGRAPRPWHIGLLTANDRRLANPMFDELARDTGLVIGDNEPYSGALQGDAMDRHGVQPGRPHVLVEIRNDLIETNEGQVEWAARLAEVLIRAGATAGLTAEKAMV